METTSHRQTLESDDSKEMGLHQLTGGAVGGRPPAFPKEVTDLPGPPSLRNGRSRNNLNCVDLGILHDPHELNQDLAVSDTHGECQDQCFVGSYY